MLAQKNVELVEKDFLTTDNMKRLCREVVSEGCVLLKNEEVLPLLDKKISLFGRCQINTFDVGYGSGGAVKAPYTIPLLEGLINGGANLNLEVVNLYKDWCSKNVIEECEWGKWPLCFPEMKLDENVVKEASLNSEIAVVIIGRSAGEDRDISKTDGSWYLNDEEREMLTLIRRYFNKLCVLINSGSIMDTSEILSYNPEALMYIWQGGQEMGNGLADVLLGKVSPCGKLTDTIALIENYPYTSHFGYPDTSYYFEDIFVGYRYFNTFKKEEIIYPFGYGLTYSNFEYKLINISKESNQFSIDIKLKNIGNFPSKEVVQIYVSKPNQMFTNPNVELVSFAKSKVLEIDEEIILNLNFDLNQFFVYDDIRNLYILESGIYKVFVGFDSINLDEVYSFELENEIIIKRSLEACAPIVPFKRMINKFGIDFEDTPLKNVDERKRILSMLQTSNYSCDKEYTFNQVKNGEISLDEFVSSLSFDYLEALTRGSLYSMNSPYGPFGNTGTFGASTSRLFELGVNSISTNDGPSGVRMGCHSTKVPNGVTIASTFNLDLIKSLAYEIGKEVIERDSHVMLAPGINIHRNPLCGRNFEYYSEDPYLTGMIASSYVLGIQEAGASACPKHFACNNQEYLRYNNDSIVSGRALREIYTKSFQICINEANPDVIMTSYNKINGEFTYYNHGLIKILLREEMGFNGLIITDW